MFYVIFYVFTFNFSQKVDAANIILKAIFLIVLEVPTMLYFYRDYLHGKQSREQVLRYCEEQKITVLDFTQEGNEQIM